MAKDNDEYAGKEEVGEVIEYGEIAIPEIKATFDDFKNAIYFIYGGIVKLAKHYYKGVKKYDLFN